MIQTALPTTRKITKSLIAYMVVAMVLLSCGAYLLFHRLDVHAITLYDEARHGINAYEMNQNGEWIVSTFLGETDYFNLKPPLSMWCIIAGYHLFGYNAIGLRFYSAAAMFLTMLIVTVWVKKRHGMLTSLFALALLVGQDLLYTGHSARFGDADGLFMLFYTIAMLCMLDSKHNFRWLYGSAVCFGLGFMTKSWHAAMIPVTCFAYLCATGQIKKLRPKQYALLLFWGLLPVLPWAILRFGQDGLAFFTQTFTTDVQERMAVTDHAPALYYFSTLLQYPATVIGLALCAAGLGFRIFKKQRPTATDLGLGLWILLPPVLYSFSGFKVYWYIFPILSGMAVAGGIMLNKLCRFSPRNALAKLLCAVLALGLCIPIAYQFHKVNGIQATNAFQRAMAEVLDRDVDSGLHVYVQYDDQLTSWMESDRLCAMLTGDALCMDEGQAAFAEDLDSALLFIDKNYLSQDLLEYYPVILQDGDVWVLQN